MSSPVIPVILSGGSGTRLWPLSRKLRPKQFLPLITEHSLLQETLLRTRGLEHSLGNPIVVCNEAHRFVVAEQLRDLGKEPGAIVLEPEGRNTAPAVAVAALVALDQIPESEDATLLVLPADHVILDRDAFIAAVESAIDAAAAGNLVAFGIVPHRPETGYGYVLAGADHGNWRVLDEFVEKPDLKTAMQYVDSGRYLWNSGMFVFSARTYLRELGRYAPQMLAACGRAASSARVDQDFMRLGSAFLDSPSDSIDYAVMEKTDRAAVVPLDAGWSDIGSWPALQEILDKDADGNVLRGDVIVESCRDSYVESNGKLVAAVGLDGVIIVETGDAVLVMSSVDSQRIKQVVERLTHDDRPEVRDFVASRREREQ